MPFDTALSRAVMRGQSTGLKAVINSVPVISGAVVNSVTPLPPGDSRRTSVALICGVLSFSFGLSPSLLAEGSEAAV
ncbi:MAG TPA: hypothetical protein PK490_22710 [Prosthecobacter sp.]|nr:hypothetical protein [Prosthecobacter sp.]HRK17111.1 hypothetical protein [Prosthecobacter sp.]